MDDDMNIMSAETPEGAETPDELSAMSGTYLTDSVCWNFSVNAETNPTDALLNWYSNLPSNQLDLVGELGDSRGVFVVSGESLLAHILVTHDELKNFSKDLNFLTATYYVERYLKLFIDAKSCGERVASSKHVGVRVVFIDSVARLLWENSCPALMCLREIVKSHLTSCLGQTVVCSFAHWEGEAIDTFFHATDIASVIVSDEGFGSLIANEYQATSISASVLLSFCLHCVTARRVRIAFLNQLEKRGNRVVALTVGPERRHELVYNLVNEKVRDLLDGGHRGWLDSGAAPVIADQPMDRLFFCQKAIQCCLNTSGSSSSLPVLKTVFVTVALMDSLSVEDRAFRTAKADWSLLAHPIVEGTLTNFVKNLLEIIKSIQPDLTTFNPDIFDGRLWRTVLLCLFEEGVLHATNGCQSTAACSLLGISPEVEDRLRSLWNEVDSSSLFDFSLGDMVIEAPDMEEPSQCEDASASLTRLTRAFPILDSAMACVDSVVSQRIASLPTAPLRENSLNHNNGTVPGSYIPETQLVTRRFEEKKKKDYEEQRLKWKHLSVDKLAARMRNWELRGSQKELRAMHQYAKSLVGADSLHHAIALVREGRIEETAAVTNTPQKVSKKAAEIIAKNIASQQKTQATKDSDQIKPLMDRAESIAEIRDFGALETALFDICSGYSRIIDSFDQFKGICTSVKLEASQVKVISQVVRSATKALKRLLPGTASHLATDEAKLGARNACAKILRLCASFVQEYAQHMEGKDIVRVQELLISLGFTHSSKNLFALWKSKQIEESDGIEVKKKGKEDKDSKESKDSKKSASDEFYVKSSKVEEILDITGGDEFLFQLIHLSSELDRPAGTQSDKRVMFKPDYWQKELLDIVDKNESALVCAPTASGKTFICYYAMEKVLRSSNDKVAVYVAPSKALMNQVDAEIYARFRSKTYPATDNVHLSGDLEKDYQHNPFNCQVLVTIPSMLEQLLLDPTMQEWVKKIEYVIFDEVHVMGESSEESAIWEHALQLIPCPFLAMSATVGNPTRFHDWLNFVAKIKNGPKVHLIEYKERYNDLAKIAVACDEQALLAIHPFTVLSYEDVLSGVIPPDLTMTPSELGLLVSVVRKSISDEDIAKSLAPRKVFEKLIPIETMVTKRLFREYEKFILDEFIRLNNQGVINRDTFGVIQSTLQKSPRIGDAKSVNELWATISSSKSGTVTKRAVDVASAFTVDGQPHYLNETWLCDFLNQLDASALLPAIIFNLDRSEIMKMVERLSSLLKSRQYEKFYGSEDRAYATRAINKKRIDAYEAQVARQRLMERKNKKDEDFDEQEIADSIPTPTMVEDEFDPEFSFAGVKAMSDPECMELIEKLGENKKIKPWVIEALRRGIGMHHEGCSTRLKKAVEILFRRGFLRVVVATGTLSLGINMPCKSTIFVGTHVKLNALNYRQMAGRAGRRGFDLLGHVVFVDSTQKNIRRLLTSELTQLGGDFALTPSHVLRAQIMLDQLLAANGGSTVQIAKRLTAMLLGGFLPFNQESKNSAATSLVILRSSLDFLVSEGLLTTDGRVTRLGSLSAFMFKREPENFILARLLLSRDFLKLIDQWLAEERSDLPTTMATFKLMQALASFGLTRPQLRGSACRKIPERKKFLPTETCPLLPETSAILPESLSGLRERYNERVVQNVVNRVRLQLSVLGDEQSEEQSEALPISGGIVTSARNPCGLSQRLKKYRIQSTKLRSVYSAIAGKGDTFSDPTDLVFGSKNRPNLLLDSASVGTLYTGQTSSYACDFLLHGKLSLLQNDCLIGVSESWKEIDEWRFFLESLNIALEYMFELDNTHEYSNLQRVVKNLAIEITSKLQLEGA